jgi:hypothetical protein
MRGRSAGLILGLAIANALVATTPATAKPLEKGHFHDVFTNFFTCATTGTPVREDVDVSGSFLVNLRGSSDFPYFRESVHGTIAWTNLNTGGTFTQAFASTSKDQTIVDNGDGTITITSFASGGSRYYDRDGNLVLRDPGEIRFAVEIDYNGTPSDPSDDEEVEGSFRVVRDSTGLNETEGRDFCADLVEFTS